MDSSANQEKTHAAFSSVLWSAFLTGIKICAGVATGSLGIISEALHSALDLLAAGMTYYAVKIAARPADDDHPYGHEKIENLSALVETGLLLLTCVWIVWEAFDRLLFDSAQITLVWWAFAVVGVSLLVDVNRAAMLRRVAKKHKSQALEADALHFTTDIWSSAVVLLGLVCVWVAGYVPKGTFWQELLEKADAIAALFVAGMVCCVAYGLVKRSVHALMDGGSEALTQQVLAAMKKEAPEYPVKRIRLRDVGAHVFVELDVEAPRKLHVDDAHDISDSIEALVKKELPAADVVVHIEPEKEDAAEQSPEVVTQRLALRHHVRIPGFYRHPSADAPAYCMDVEVPAEWPLKRGFEVVESFRADVARALNTPKITCRIEPDSRDVSADGAPTPLRHEEIRLKADAILRADKDIGRVIRIQSEADPTPTVNGTSAVAATRTLQKRPRKATRLEKQPYPPRPGLARVTVLLQPEQE